MALNISKRFKNNSDLILTICLALGILVAINFFAYHFFARRDLTAAGIYSISPATKDTIKKLPDVVQVKVYFSKDLPSQFLPVRQSLTDVLDEYRSYSSNFKVSYIDPGDGKEAEAAGIPKLQFNDLKQDKLEVVNGYMGLVINYRGKSEVIPAVQNIGNFEYELTSRVKKLTGDMPTVGFVSGHGSPSLTQDMPALAKEITKLYPVEEVSLAKIPDGVKTLVIVGPKDKFSDSELKNLDQFLMQGNAVIALVDGVDVGQNLQPTDNQSNLIDQLAKYGVKVNRDLVLDQSAGVAVFNQGIVSFSVAYPFWPRIINKDFDQNNPLVASLNNIVLPWASSLDIDQGKLAAGEQVSYLAKSSPASWLAQGSFKLDPSQQFVPPAQTSDYNLALMLSGNIKSAYGNATSDKARLFVVGDSDFIQDNFWSGNPDNLVLMQNMLDGANLGSDLIGIRAKKISDRSLAEMTAVNKEIVRYLNIFGLTVIVLAFGLIRYYLRKKTKMIEI